VFPNNIGHSKRGIIVPPIITQDNDEIFAGRIPQTDVTKIRLSINPMTGRTAVFISADEADALADVLKELAREVRAFQ
jgi:hypothetical protein